MQIGTKFTVAIHILLIVETFKEDCKVTSDFIASSVRTNPVVIRKIMSLLRDAGLIEIAAGTGGIKLTRTPEEITLLEIYRASDSVKEEKLFKIHEDTELRCPVGGNIAPLLEGYLFDAQTAMEAELAKTSLSDLLQDLTVLRKETNA